MHLQAVFILVDILGHPVELASFVQIRCRRCVNWKVAQWCAVVCAFCQRRLLKVEVVRRAQKKDTLAVSSVSTSSLASNDIPQISPDMTHDPRERLKRDNNSNSLTPCLHPRPCMRMPRAGQSMSSQRVWQSISAQPTPLIDQTYLLRPYDDPGTWNRQLVHLLAFSCLLYTSPSPRDS